MKELINLRLDENDLEILKDIARKEDRTISYLIRKAIKNLIAGKEIFPGVNPVANLTENKS